ncbi:MAG TPA: hypothetical protein VHE79_06630, partial [Spirochaetia bacterium]
VRFGIRTLTVRIGWRAAIVIYCALLGLAYAGTVVLWAFGFFPRPWLVFLAVPLAVPPFLLMGRPPARRKPIIPLVMLHHLGFGVLYCVSWFAG